MNFPCRFTLAGVNTGKRCTRGSHCAVLGRAVLGCSAENSRIACGRGPRLWESENASLGEDLQPPQLWHPRDPPAPALEPLPKLQVIHSEICGPPFPALVPHKLAWNGRWVDEGQPWQCRGPPWASVSPRGHDIRRRVPPPSSLTNSDHL